MNNDIRLEIKTNKCELKRSASHQTKKHVERFLNLFKPRTTNHLFYINKLLEKIQYAILVAIPLEGDPSLRHTFPDRTITLAH